MVDNHRGREAERDAQAAHACLTLTRGDAPISAARLRPFLAALCVPEERDGRVGCAGCAPDFNNASVQPDTLTEVSRLVEGSFTSAGASEVLLSFGPCEARQASSPLVLLRRELGQVRRVDALPPGSSGRCAASAVVHGYSRLVCATSAADDRTAAGGVDTSLDVLDLHRRRYLRLVGIRNTRRAACADGQRAVLREFAVVEAGFRDLDGDGLEDVSVRALWSTGPEPQRYDASCRDLFQPPDDWMAVQAELRALACELPDTHCGTLEIPRRRRCLPPHARDGSDVESARLYLFGYSNDLLSVETPSAAAVSRHQAALRVTSNYLGARTASRPTFRSR